VTLAYRTGGRTSAILDLTWDRVDFEHGVIRLGLGDRPGKGRATVPMVEDTAETLREVRRCVRSNHVIQFRGVPVGSIKKAFKRAVTRANLPQDTSPHILRHSAAVHMAESGVPMEEIGQYLGHNDARTTYRIYARFSPSYLRRAAAVLE
jgi:integrase